VSLTTTIAVGTALGGVAAVAIYTSMAPVPTVTTPVGHEVSVLAVPTPTKTVLAPCVKPAVLEKGVCVTHVAAPPAPAPVRQPAGTTSSTSASQPTTAPTQQDDGDHDGDPGDSDHDGGGGGHDD